MSQQVPNRIKTVTAITEHSFDYRVTDAIAEVRESGSRVIGVRLDSQYGHNVIFIAHILIVDPQPKPESADAQDRDPA